MIIRRRRGPKSLLNGYLSEDQLSAEIGKSKRTLRLWRQRRVGPPWAPFGKEVLYSREGFLAYLKSIELAPRQTRKKAA